MNDRVRGTGVERRVFRHPMPALGRLHEAVPDFDLLDVVALDAPDDPDERPR